MKIERNMSKKKIIKGLSSSESAAATAIAAVLLLSIIFTIFAIVRIGYVPEWKTDAEKLYMSEAQKDMIEFKHMTDVATAFMISDLNYSSHPFTTTVPFSMGGGEIPVFEPSKSSGTISVNTEPCNIIITKDSPIPGFPQKVVANLTLGGVTYNLDNRQYVDQTFRYENGALILKQGNKSLMRQSPSFITCETVGDYNIYKVSIMATNIKGNPETVSSGIDASLKLNGTGLVNYSNNTSKTYIDSFYCNITTKYPDAWESYFQETAKKAKLKRDRDYNLNKTDSGIYFNFTPTNGKILETFYINEAIIQTQLSTNNLRFRNTNNANENETERKLIHADKMLLTKKQKGGIICSGSYIQFTNRGTDNYIEINGIPNNLVDGDVIRLKISKNQVSGSATIGYNGIYNFYFDVKMYINGELKDMGKVTSIYISDYSDYKSSLTYKLPSYLSKTKIVADEKTIIDSTNNSLNNSSINLYNIGPSVDGTLIFIFNEGYTDFQSCSADYEIINS